MLWCATQISCRTKAPFPQLPALLSAEAPWLDLSPGVVFLPRELPCLRLCFLSRVSSHPVNVWCIRQRPPQHQSSLQGWYVALLQLYISSTSVFLCCPHSFTVVADHTPQIAFCLQISVSQSISQGTQPMIPSTSVVFISENMIILSVSLSLAVSEVRAHLIHSWISTLNATKMLS